MPHGSFPLPFYYVYVWIDPRSGKPIYVGKGTASNARNPYDRATHRHKGNDMLERVCELIAKAGLEVTVEIRDVFRSESEAHAEEKRLIALYGRRQSKLQDGTLCNLTAGGEGNINPPDCTRAKIAAAARRNWADPQYKARTAESVRRAFEANGEAAKIGRRTKEAWSTPEGRLKFQVALKQAQSAPLVRQKKSARTTTQWADPVTRQRMIAGLRKGWTPERRAKQLAKTWGDPAFKAAVSEKLSRAAIARYQTPAT